MVSQLKASASRPDDLSLLSGARVVEGETPTSCSVTSTHGSCVHSTHIQTHIKKENQSIDKIDGM